AQADGDDAQVTHRNRAVPRLRVADRRLARPYALEEVAHVVVALVERGLLRVAERLAEDLRPARLDLAAGVVDPAVLALELYALLRLALLERPGLRAEDRVGRGADAAVADAVGVSVLDRVLGRRRVPAGDRIDRRLALDRARPVDAQAPQRDVVVVG